MSTPEVPQPATIADILTEMRLQRMEARTDRLETRALIAEVRADVTDVRTHQSEILARLNTLVDELAAFRAEYNSHTHE